MTQFLTLATILAACMVSAAKAANIDVFEMSFTTSVRMDGGQDSAYVLVPTNPLVTTRHAQLGLTEATTVFDLAWGPAGGRFDFLFDQVIDDSDDYVASQTVGGVKVTSDVDLWLDYDYIYSYSHLTGDIAINSTIRITHITDDGFSFLMNSVLLGGAPWLRPPSGTFTSTTQILLEAGERYSISYNIKLDAAEETGAIGFGNGSLHFTLTPVPESGVAWLFILAGGMVRRRGRRNWGDW
ncbi:MAG: hypothetical protein H6819_03580 [Phycisphaerales bacterium]|nr:hypothetical protein [Phycisphaerales bacterium]MCB9856278.1 hypothetical protein [Phycisphaerales bacterium]MCB9863283.1 hypothetical protein [Phycisphaerales bacterium]